jgi:hypothetical protein
MAPLGGMERPRRAVRFARLIHRRGRDLGGPSARAAFGGNLTLPWLPHRVIPHETVLLRRSRRSHASAHGPQSVAVDAAPASVGVDIDRRCAIGARRSE